MPTLPELNEQLAKLSTDWKAKYDSAPEKTLADGSKARELSAEDVKALRDMQTEMDTLGAKRDELQKVEDTNAQIREELSQPANRIQTRASERDNRPVRKSAGQAFLESPEYKASRANGFRPTGEIDVLSERDTILALKTVMTTGANGFPPEVLRDGDVVGLAYRPPQVIDYLPMYPTTQSGISFMAQSVRTNNAAARSENASTAEAALTWVNSTDIISSVAVSIPVTLEELEDEPGLGALVNSELMMMVKQMADEYVTVGTAAPPVFAGIFNATGIQTQAKAADVDTDAAYKAMVKVRVTGRANPNLFVFHSTDWQEIALTRTADGIYIWGSPQDATVRRLWGLPVVESEALTVTNALCLDTSYFHVAVRQGVRVDIGEDTDDFRKLRKTVRANMRLGLKKRRGAAACKITGL